MQQFRMILPSDEQTTMLFLWLLLIMFLCKSLHVWENRFAPAFGQNFICHRKCTHSVLLTCQMLTQSYSFLVVGILPELPCTNSLVTLTSKRPVSSFVMWQNVPEFLIHVFFMNMGKISSLMVHTTPASIGPFVNILPEPNFLFYFFFIFQCQQL